MSTAGLRELRQNASDLVRLAEAGDTVTITVSGREVAQLGPLQQREWRHWAEISSIFEGPEDLEWQRDRDRLDQRPVDPFAR